MEANRNTSEIGNRLGPLVRSAVLAAGGGVTGGDVSGDGIDSGPRVPLQGADGGVAGSGQQHRCAGPVFGVVGERAVAEPVQGPALQVVEVLLGGEGVGQQAGALLEDLLICPSRCRPTAALDPVIPESPSCAASLTALQSRRRIGPRNRYSFGDTSFRTSGGVPRGGKAGGWFPMGVPSPGRRLSGPGRTAGMGVVSSHWGNVVRRIL